MVPTATCSSGSENQLADQSSKQHSNLEAPPAPSVSYKSPEMYPQPVAGTSPFDIYYQQAPPRYYDQTFASLAYKPLQGPPQHFSPAGFIHPGALNYFHPPNFRRYQHPAPPQYHPHQTLNMASYQLQGTTDAELAEFQKLSNEYEPEVQGPLVSQLQPSTAITTEFASADPVYREKTAALPQKYSHYRTVRGDGKCGWRAVAFGYFETLAKLNDVNKFSEEEARLRSLSNVLNAAGYEPYLYEDFAEETFELLRNVRSAMQAGNVETALLDAFNNEYLQNNIITHLRTLTAAWMKTHHGDYAPYLTDLSVDDFCNSSVLPISSEIDNVSLSALKDVFLDAAGITLEIIYLDRSQGIEANMHRYMPSHHGGRDIGTIRLLYRPGHYDLLYMPQEVPLAPTPASIPAFLQYDTRPNQEPAQAFGHVNDFMTMIPGMSFVTPHAEWSPHNSSGQHDFTAAASQPVQQWPQPAPVPSIAVNQPHLQPPPFYMPAMQTRPVSSPIDIPQPPRQISQALPVRPASISGTSMQSGLQRDTLWPFRPSSYMGDPALGFATSHMPFRTTPMRESPFNKAHYLNPDFCPDEYDWEKEEKKAAASRTSRYRRSG